MKILQEVFMVQKDGVIYFLYVDNIVFAFKKKKSDKIKRIVELVLQTLIIEVIRELKQFL